MSIATDSLIGPYRVIRRIGQGTYSQIFEGLGNEKRVALKVQKPSAGVSLSNEVEVLQALCGLSVPEIFWTEKDHSIIAMTLFGDSLSSIRRQGTKIDQQTVGGLSLQILEISSQMHRRGFVHRDIKSSNVCLRGDTLEGPTTPIAMIDFGSAGKIGSTGFRGTSAYLSPSMEISRGVLGPIDDLWAIAFVALDLSLEGGLPWKKMKVSEDKADFLKKMDKNGVLGQIFQKLSEEPVSYEQALSLMKNSFGFLARNKRKLDSNDSEFTAPAMPRHLLWLAQQESVSLEFSQKSSASLLLSVLGLRDSANSTRHELSKFGAFSKVFTKNSTLSREVLAAAGLLACLPPVSNLCGLSSKGAICLKQIVTGECTFDQCPLVHQIPDNKKSNNVCLRFLLTGFCDVDLKISKTNSSCSKIHPNLYDIDRWVESGNLCTSHK